MKGFLSHSLLIPCHILMYMSKARHFKCINCPCLGHMQAEEPGIHFVLTFYFFVALVQTIETADTETHHLISSPRSRLIHPFIHFETVILSLFQLGEWQCSQLSS